MVMLRNASRNPRANSICLAVTWERLFILIPQTKNFSIMYVDPGADMPEREIFCQFFALIRISEVDFAGYFFYSCRFIERSLIC